MNRSALGWSVATVLALAHAVGCDGDAETSPDSGADLRRQYCEAAIARDERCGRQPDTLERCLYNEDSQCFFDLVRPEILEDVIACLEELPCSDDAIVCVYDVGVANPTAGQQDFLTACTTKEDACQPGSTFSDYCGLPFAATATYERMSACLELACDQVLDCLRGARPASCQ